MVLGAPSTYRNPHFIVKSHWRAFTTLGSRKLTKSPYNRSRIKFLSFFLNKSLWYLILDLWLSLPAPIISGIPCFYYIEAAHCSHRFCSHEQIIHPEGKKVFRALQILRDSIGHGLWKIESAGRRFYRENANFRFRSFSGVVSALHC